LAFSLAERYFCPAMGRKGQKYLSAREKVGRYGEKLPDVFILRCSTITTCKPEYICTGIQLIINLFFCLTKQF